MTKFVDIKRKSLSLFQSDYIQLQSVVPSITSWERIVQAVLAKKKGGGKEKERKEVENKRRGKRDGKSLFGRKEKGEKEMWKKR